ncbi:MAG: DNA/RNA nuclease SfsA [Hyphomicrobiaceae bacterium]|nr:DNA/RNA nuclease SfsA [Hyphomicrobiaceae bacterium]
MQFPKPLIPGQLIKRYKRFLADVKFDDGREITAHCANPGSMLGLAEPGSTIWLSESDNPKRKLKFSWELIEVDLGSGPTLVGINTSHPNALVAEAIQSGAIPELSGYPALRREVKYGVNSRIDILLEDSALNRCYVEIKNVHLMRKCGLAEFPDSVTTRGAKHLGELANMVREGHRAFMVYLIQRGDAESFSLARDIDPGYGEAFDAAMEAGVEALAYACDISEKGIDVTTRVPIRN